MSSHYRACLLLMLCVSIAPFFSKQAQAQCSAHDALHRHLDFLETSPGVTPPIESAASTGVWKSIQTGTFRSKTALYEALEDAHCGIGDTAEQILVTPEFVLSGIAVSLDLVVMSLPELGFARKKVELREIYTQAQKLGFALPAAEVGPQLRLQYLDQPMGEFLVVAMAPIRTRTGASCIFIVANGGAGLLLLGAEVNDSTEYYPSSRFVFVRPISAARAEAASHGK
jgi:hypothetical protein